MDAAALLRPGLLADRVIALGGGGEVLAAPLATLGARVAPLPVTLDEEAMAAAVDPATDVLLHDLRPAFATGGGDALRSTLDGAWIAARAVATTAFIPDGRGGRMLLVAPPPDERDAAAAAVRAAAENLARTLSIEWSRYAITTVAITPGGDTREDDLGALAAYLASPAGDYFSGCRLALGEAGAAA